MSNDKETQRPESYPKPTETDSQLKNQDEYTERQSNRNSEDLPVQGGTGQAETSSRENTQSGEEMP